LIRGIEIGLSPEFCDTIVRTKAAWRTNITEKPCRVDHVRAQSRNPGAILEFASGMVRIVLELRGERIQSCLSDLEEDELD
jgi:hypothetical protein